MSGNHCELCINNKDGVVNIAACQEVICPVADSTAFKYLLEENRRLNEQIRIVDEDWQKRVTEKACELVALLR